MDIFNYQTQKIQEIKSWFNFPLLGILKYVQNWDNFLNQDFFWKNTTLFINEAVINSFINKINVKLKEIKAYKKEVKSLNISYVEKKFLINSLNIT